MATIHEISEEIVNRTGVDSEVLAVFNGLQGHVGNLTKQRFRVERRRELKHPKLKLEMREYLVRDQFTNLYAAFAADLIDGERHMVPSFIGSDTKGLNKKYSMFKKFSDTMMAHLQDEAWVLFGRQTVAIMRAREDAGVVTLINTTQSPSDLAKQHATAVDAPVIAVTAAPVAQPSTQLVTA